MADESPIPMLLTCPSCSARHIDEGDFATWPHTTHACQKCGMCWKPALVPTVGVQFLPGYKNAPAVFAAECPRGHSKITRLEQEIQGPIEDALRCHGCPANYVRINQRWFEAPEKT